MSDSLSITAGAQPEGWVITANLVNNTILPSQIFLYENTGTSTLGRYVGVSTVAQLGRYQIWQGIPIPSFGNAYVRHDQAKITLPLGDDELAIRSTNNLIATAKALKAEMQAEASSTRTVIL